MDSPCGCYFLDVHGILTCEKHTSGTITYSNPKTFYEEVAAQQSWTHYERIQDSPEMQKSRKDQEEEYRLNNQKEYIINCYQDRSSGLENPLWPWKLKSENIIKIHKLSPEIEFTYLHRSGKNYIIHMGSERNDMTMFPEG